MNFFAPMFSWKTVLLAVLLSAGHCAAAATNNAVPLAYFLSQAEMTHPRLAAGQAVVAHAQAGVSSARALWFPSVTAGPYGETDADNRNSVRSLSPFAISLQQQIWDFGRINAGTQAATKALAATQSEYSRLKLDVIQRVTACFVEAVFAQKLETLRDRTLKDRSALSARVATLVGAGVRPQSDLTRAQIDLEGARSDMYAARKQRIVTLQHLFVAAGMDLESRRECEVADILQTLPNASTNTDLVAVALRTRPDIQAAQWVIKQKRAEISAMQRKQYPSLAASASVSTGDRQVMSSENDWIPPEAEGHFVDWTVTVNLGWTGFNLPSVRADIAATRATLMKVLADYRELENNVVAEVRVAEISLTESLQQVGVSDALCAATQENFKLILKRYESGASTILDLTDGQMKLTEAEAALLRARADSWISASRLYWAIAPDSEQYMAALKIP